MKRAFWVLLLTLGCLLLALGGFAGWLLYRLDGQRLRPLIERRVAEATGTTLRIGGPLRFTLLPAASVSVEDLHLGAAAGQASQDQWLLVPRLTMRFRLWPLLRGQYHIRSLNLQAPRLVVSASAPGRAGERGAPASSGQTSGAAAPMSAKPRPAGEARTLGRIDEIVVHDGLLRLEDEKLGGPFELSSIQFKIRDLDGQRPMRIKLDGRLEGRPIEVEGHLGPLGSEPGRASIALDLVLSVVQQARLHVKGTVAQLSTEPSFDLALKLEPCSPRRLFQALGIKPLPPTADPGALEKVAFAGSLQGDRGSLKLSDGRLELDGAAVELAFSSTDPQRLAWRGSLRSPRLDLGRYLPAAPAKRPTGADSAGASVFSGRIDHSGQTQPVSTGLALAPPAVQQRGPAPPPRAEAPLLQRLALETRIDIDQLAWAELACHAWSTDLSLKQGELRLSQMRGTLFGGQLTGNALLDAVGKRPDGALTLELKGFDAGQATRALWQRAIVAGRGNLDWELRCPDLRAADRLERLAGHGQIALQQGRWLGFDLDAMIHNSDGAFGLMRLGRGDASTAFSELVVPMQLEAGRLKIQQARMASAAGVVNANGHIVLAERRLDLRAEPVIAAGVASRHREIRVPVLVTGTLDSPVFQPDLKTLAEQQLEQKLFESKTYRKMSKQADLQPLEKKAKALLRGLLDGGQ